MADEIRINRQSSSGAQQSAMRPEQTETSKSEANGSSARPWVILGIVAVALIVLGVVFRDKLFQAPKDKAAVTSSAPSRYSAVFLTNGQVYFGIISDVNENYANLKDIYYLQVGPAQGSGSATNTPQNISLVKLGQELHGPVDEMHISRSQILFYENLKAEGNVVRAIEAYKANPANAPAK